MRSKSICWQHIQWKSLCWTIYGHFILQYTCFNMDTGLPLDISCYGNIWSCYISTWMIHYHWMFSIIWLIFLSYVDMDIHIGTLALTTYDDIKHFCNRRWSKRCATFPEYLLHCITVRHTSYLMIQLKRLYFLVVPVGTRIFIVFVAMNIISH